MSDSLNISTDDPQKIISPNYLTLNDPQNLWLLNSGQIDIFALGLELHDKPKYLFTLQAPHFLFPVFVQETPFGAIAIPQGEALLSKVDLLSGLNFFELETWFKSICSILPNLLSTDSLPVTIDLSNETEKQTLKLQKGQTFQPSENQVIWVEIIQGTVEIESIVLTPTSGIFALCDYLPLTSTTETELKIGSLPTEVDKERLLEGLENFYRLIFEILQKHSEHNQAQYRAQLEKKLFQKEQVTRETLAELTSFLGPRQQSALIPLQETPLLTAMGAVGRALRVSIYPPAESEDLKHLKNPLEAIVRASRLQSRRVMLSDLWWKKDCGVLLGYTNSGTPVALLPVRGKGYQKFDPLDLTFTPINQTVASQLTTEAFMFYRTFPDREIKGWDVMKFVFRDNFWDIALVGLTSISATLLNMLVPIFTGRIVNEVIPNNETTLLLQFGAILLMSSFGVTMFQLTQGFTFLRLEAASDAPTQGAFWDRILHLKTTFFRDYSVGDLQSRIAGISKIRQQLSTSTLSTLLNSFFAILNLCLMFYYNPKLTLLAIIITIISVIVTTIHGYLSFRQTQKLLNLEGNLFGIVVQLINGVKKLRVAAAEERAFAYWGNLYSKRAKLKLGSQLISDNLAIFNLFISPVSTIFLFWFAVGATKNNLDGSAGLSIGNFLAFNASFGTFIASATGLSNTLLSTLSTFNLWQRAEPILKTHPEIDQNKADPGKLTGKIVVDHVSFSYQVDGALILNDITFSVKPGEFIAIVGPSGSGKSTLLRLLLGFETPTTGSIYYDNKDLSKLNLQALRRQLGVVLQNGRLQAGSIFNNIAGSALISQDDAWEAARMAGFADDIKAMPMQMNTVVSEGGTNLSGGQRQRLLIARALVLKPKILLFDEATSALDNKTQAIVSSSLEQLRVTRMVIAHRLSTIQNANYIYVISKGEIIQRGTFNELLAQEGLFAELMKRQMT